MKKKNNFIACKILLILLLIGGIILAICAYQFLRVSIAKVYTHKYFISFELDNQHYELLLTHHCSANPDSLIYEANV